MYIRSIPETNKLCVPYFRLHKVHSSFVGLSIRFYNKIPQGILELSYTSFQAKIKHGLIQKAYYTLNDYLNDKNPWVI